MRPQFQGIPVIGILRGCSAADLPHIVDAVRRGGMTHLEITMNSPGAEEQIRDAIRISEGAVQIGAGTVTDVTLLDRALAAGAKFIVTPLFTPEVIEACLARVIPVFPGAFSPTEIYSAWEMGAAMVKVFPAEVGGPTFIRGLKGPFPDIQLLPTGGVDIESLPRLLDAGAAGAGIGTPLFKRDRIENGDWTWLEGQARAFVAAYKARFP